MILSCSLKVENGCSPIPVDKAWQVIDIANDIFSCFSESFLLIQLYFI